MTDGSAKLAIVTLAILVSTAVASSDPRGWTAAENKEFQKCVSHLKAEGPTANDSAFCEMAEEHTRWMRAHPEVTGRKEDSVIFH